MRVTAPRNRWPKRSTGMNALLLDAQTKFRMEECASGMEQKSTGMNALLLDAQTMFRKEECA